MSSVITHAQVRRQLAAMACDYFDIGILRHDSCMLLREAWTATQIEQEIQRLRRENARGAHIFVRPCGTHALSLIDDLRIDAIARMRDAGFQPALVVETSPQNFQVWLNHGRTLDRNMGSWAAKELAKRFGGDLSSADWRHFGRLAGFTNQKPERRLESGLPPFVRLRQSKGRVYSAAANFLGHVTTLAATIRRVADTCSQPASQVDHRSIIRPLQDFHADPRYGGDLHRADMAWALYAASRGLLHKQISAEILRGRDLTKKGGRQRQLDYASRTAIKAVATVSPVPFPPLCAKSGTPPLKTGHSTILDEHLRNLYEKVLAL